MKKQKPIRILCLHDENSNGYKMKMSMWPLLLKVEQKVNVEHVYMNSPLIDYWENKKQMEAEQNGQKLDKIPIKKGLGWYLKDIYEVKKKFTSSNNNQNNVEYKTRYTNIQKSLDFLREVLDRQGPFDGILGIGQGAIMASILSMRRVGLGQMHANKPFTFNFCILVEARSCNEDEQFEREFELAKTYLKLKQKQQMEKLKKSKSINLKKQQSQVQNKKNNNGKNSNEVFNSNNSPNSNNLNQQPSQNLSQQDSQSFMITNQFSFDSIQQMQQQQSNINNQQKSNQHERSEENMGNNSVEMQSLHIYANTNKEAASLKEYFVKEKMMVYKFETIDQRIPQIEKDYFKMKGHQIKKNGPTNLILPSEASEDYINFLNKYQQSQVKKVVNKKPDVPKKQELKRLNSEGDERLNTDNLQQNEGGLFTDYNDMTKFKAQQVFSKAKKGCLVSKEYPCVYKLSKVALSRKSKKQQDTIEHSSSNSESIKQESFRQKKDQFCDYCKKFTNEAIYDLIQEGKRRLLPKMAFKNSTLITTTNIQDM